MGYDRKRSIAIHRRDRWLCRWCKRPVIFAPVMRLIELEMFATAPDLRVTYFHGGWSRSYAPLLDELGAVLDHMTARSAGGDDSEGNLATACNKCNGRKSAAALDEFGKRPKPKPIKGKDGEPKDWDGLSSLFVALSRRYPTKLTEIEKDWVRALSPTNDVDD